MVSINKITTALASTTSELTVTAANLNVDFSLVKVEAPQEYLALGQNLSKKRREDAELGSTHATAGKLAALFNQIIPCTPNLVRAYGLRVSEISSSPSVNPEGPRSNYGIFADSVGVDATSIWAAATSGPAAVSVHLLGCLLARFWNATEATSIWVEIVTKRKAEIIASVESNNSVLFETFSAARQELTRSHLADWDASARAWLESADEVYKVRNRQLKLILDNINLPVNRNLDPYHSAMTAWKSAMTTLEDLILGMPQRVQSAETLLALSAWHIYPDILALGSNPTPVEMNDKLVEKGGTLTIGLAYESTNREQGIRWALSLAHLRHYGDPTISSKSLEKDSSRISFDELTLVALGSLVWAWGGKQADSLKIAKALVVLWEALTEKKGGPPDDVNIKYTENMQRNGEKENRTFPWIGTIARAASDLISAQGDEQKIAQRLVGSGFRNGRSFLAKKNCPPEAYFGLCVVSTLRRVMNSEGQEELDRYMDERSTECRKSGKQMCSKDSPGVASHVSGSLPESNEGSEIIQIDAGTSAEIPSPTKNDANGKWTINVHQQDILPMTYVLNILKPDTIDSENLQVYFVDYFGKRYYVEEIQPSSQVSFGMLNVGSCRFLQSLDAFSLAADLYKLLPGATVAIRVISSSLYKALYYESRNITLVLNKSNLAAGIQFKTSKICNKASVRSNIQLPVQDNMSCAEAFSCLALFDSGHLRVAPNDLSKVMAMSTGNSIYVASPLLCDPFQQPAGFEIKRIIGNIGRAGIAMLVPPLSPQVRSPDPASWRVVAHEDFDGKPYDGFAQTSMHLSFSGWEKGLHLRNYGLCDEQAILLESVVSVHDRGKWVADVDILRALMAESKMLVRDPHGRHSCSHSHPEKVEQPTRGPCKSCHCKENTGSCERDSDGGSANPSIKEQPELQKTAIDCWEELLEAPENVCVVRAHGNWIGRLAATCVAYQMGRQVDILPEDVCWKCVDELNKDRKGVVYIS